MKNFIAALITSFALAGFAANLPAADSAPAEKPATVKRPEHIPFLGTVTAVDQAAKTISLTGTEKDRLFHLAAGTKIIRNGRRATLAEAVVGDYATGAYLRKDGTNELKSIKLGPAPKEK